MHIILKERGQITDAITQYCIGKDYQEGMREATNLDTLQERLRNKEYLNYTFQDTGWGMAYVDGFAEKSHGEWRD